MSCRKLPNYIRSHRKCHGFSQGEIAFLLCSTEGAKISRYEHFVQHPNVETAIALEIMFRTPVRKLFAGVSEKVEHRILVRATLLANHLKQHSQDRAVQRKIEALEALCMELRQLNHGGA